MKITVQGVNFNALDSLEEYVEKKVSKLTTFYDQL
jgi:ribosome-associated translation inhibitor RaiA